MARRVGDPGGKPLQPPVPQGQAMEGNRLAFLLRNKEREWVSGEKANLSSHTALAPERCPASCALPLGPAPVYNLCYDRNYQQAC